MCSLPGFAESVAGVSSRVACMQCVLNGGRNGTMVLMRSTRRLDVEESIPSRPVASGRTSVDSVSMLCVENRLALA